jgi:poly(A) polymerase
LKVLYRLNKSGYDAYLVGGAVRDLLLNLHPKDYDIATNATPNDLKKLFRNCRLIGKRFRLAHIHFGKEIIEVATFRGEGKAKHNDKGMITRDNTYGTLTEDAFRRDLTINAMYYNIDDFSIVDLADGMSDIEDKIIRIMGDPIKRYQEDPVRMLRVIRLAAKLQFSIEDKTAKPIPSMAHLLGPVSNSRLFDETLKLFHKGAAFDTFCLLEEYHLLHELFPATLIHLGKDQQVRDFIYQALQNTDERIKQGKTVTPAFLFSALLWHPMLAKVEQLESEGLPTYQAHYMAMSQALTQQVRRTSIPKFFSSAIKDIWQLQFHLTRKLDNRAFKTLRHPRFRAAYDFLLIRADIYPEFRQRADWWTDFQFADDNKRNEMIPDSTPPPRKPRGGKKPSSSTPEN